MSQPHTSRPAQGRRAAAPAPRAGRPSTADFSRPGAIDLSQFATQDNATAVATAAAGDYCVEVTEQELNDVIQQSLNYPVILALLSAADPGCARVRATLTSLSGRANGRWLLATVDVDAQPRIAQALRVTAIPTVMALLAGQAMPLFQGTADEQQISGVIDQVLASAVANGVTGRVPPPKHSDSGPDPRFAAADAAMQSGDYATARDEFDKLLRANPKDADAAAGKATAELLVRSADADVNALVSAADVDPDDVDKALAAADAQLVVGQTQQGLGRLIGLIRTTSGEDRERLRQRVLELFETLDPADPVLLEARRGLGAALY